MSEWKETKLSEYILTNNCSVDSKYPYKFIKYLDTGSITQNKIETFQDIEFNKSPSRARRLVKDGDIVYSTVRPNQLHYGFIKNPPENLVVSTGFVVIECKKNILDSKYLYYYLSQNETTDYLHSIAEASTSAYPSLKPSDIESLVVLLPPLEEQKAIVSVLSSLDDKIDLLHRQNKTLEAMAETLFRQWFIEEADDSWEEGKLSDEFDFTMGQSPPGESYNETGEGIAMYQGNADFEFRFPRKRVYTTEPKRFAEKYDTLISVRAPVGAQNMANEKCCIGRGVAAFRLKHMPEYYSYTYFKLKSLMKEIEQYNHTGTVFGSISKSDFDNISIKIPPIEIVKEFQGILKPLDDKLITNCLQIQTVEKLRNTLLPKLMSGEVRVAV